MKKRILAVFLAMAVMAGLLCGCGEATTQSPAASDETTDSSRAEHGNEITVGIAQDLDDSLDPYQMTAAVNWCLPALRRTVSNAKEVLLGNFLSRCWSDLI